MTPVNALPIRLHSANTPSKKTKLSKNNVIKKKTHPNRHIYQ